MLWCACYARLRFIELMFGHVLMKWGTLCKSVFFWTETPEVKCLMCFHIAIKSDSDCEDGKLEYVSRVNIIKFQFGSDRLPETISKSIILLYI